MYILSNNFRNVLYIGVTRNIERRLYEHKNKLIDGFSKKYNLNVLLFYETTEYALDAIAREKQLKKWNRDKKFALIKSINPELRDLSDDWWLLYESFTGLTIACEQAIVEISRVIVSKIQRPRQTYFLLFMNKQQKLGLDSLHFTIFRFGRDDVSGAFFFKVLNVSNFYFYATFK